MATHSDLRTTKLTSFSGSGSGSSQRSSLVAPNQQNLIAAIAYLGLGVVGIAILILEKNNRYIRFHAMQATLIYAVIVFFNISKYLLPLGNLGFFIEQFITPVAAIVLIVLVYKAYSGEMYELPVVGQYARQRI